MRADKMVFEKKYPDDTGVEFSVELDGDQISVMRNLNRVRFSYAQLDWMIDALCRIREEFQKGTAL
ncbi:MAG: hypothetical protein AB7R40_26470 [Nitrospiraceae bacterium]